MNLPANLQQEVEKWASFQGLTLEQFIFQTIAEKINRLNQQIQEPSEEEPATYYEGRVLVVDAPLPPDFDLVAFIDNMRDERIQELMP
ncbi:hypothetical protein NIES4071_36580 [Calothrix sp. NIES-4071]|nr:hypothetical protein NIES4071_36580 [Calothrix sp. NIES-4071]BAZ57977.1 hypothetical protein NIES4105_36510 [Calothrix sp. NIES-4105]